jgi:hypothetical protein
MRAHFSSTRSGRPAKDNYLTQATTETNSFKTIENRHINNITSAPKMSVRKVNQQIQQPTTTTAAAPTTEEAFKFIV